MRRYESGDKKHTYKVICNQCKKEIPVQNGIPTEETFHGEAQWGYFSHRDGEKHSFDLCETCYEKWIAGFALPIEIKEMTELL